MYGPIDICSISLFHVDCSYNYSFYKSGACILYLIYSFAHVSLPKLHTFLRTYFYAIIYFQSTVLGSIFVLKFRTTSMNFFLRFLQLPFLCYLFIIFAWCFYNCLVKSIYISIWWNEFCFCTFCMILYSTEYVIV